MQLAPHQKQQVLYIAGAGALLVGYLWYKGQGQGGLRLAPLPPVSGGYINTDTGSSAPTSQPVANSCPSGYVAMPGGSCGLQSAIQSNQIAVNIPGGSVTQPSCTSAGCR